MISRALLRSAALGVATLTLGAAPLVLGPVGAASAAPALVTVAPPSGSIVAASLDGSVSFTLAGTGESGEELTVTAEADGAVVTLCVTPVAPDDTWSCTVTSAPDFPGPVTVSNGVESMQLAFGVLHPPVIDADASDPTTFTPTVTMEHPEQLVTGHGAPGALVRVLYGDGTGCSGMVGPDGVWGCTLAMLPTGEGPYTITASQAYPSAPEEWVSGSVLRYALSGGTVLPEVPVVPEPPMPTDPPVPPDPPVTPEQPDVPPAPGLPGEPGAPAPDTPTPAVDEGPHAGGERADAENSAGAGDAASGAASAPSQRTGAGSTNAPRPSSSARGGDGAAGIDGQLRQRGGSGHDAGPRAGRGGGEVEAGGAGDSAGSPGSVVVEPAVGPAGRPSAFALSLRSWNESLAALRPPVWVFLAMTAGLAMLAVFVPGGLLESTVHENAERIGRSRPARWLSTVRHRARRLLVGRSRTTATATATPQGFTRQGFTRQAGRVAALLAVGAAVSVAVSPEAGPDAATLRLFAGLVGATVVLNAVPMLATAGYAHHRWGSVAEVVTRPAALLLTATAVVLSRVTGLEPGFVFGLLIGLRFGVALGRRAGAQTVLVSSGTLLALGLGTWLAQSALRPVALSTPGIGVSLGLDLLTAVTVGALSAPLVSLLPLRFLDGKALFESSRAGWAAAYATTWVLASAALFPQPETWSEVIGPLEPWLVAFGLFVVLSLAVWAWFRFVPERAAHPEPAALVESGRVNG